MKRLVIIERFCLAGHILSKVFGLAGLLLVVPHAEMILNLAAGQTAIELSLAGGGVVDILLGTLAVSIYAYRTLGLRPTLAFMLPAMSLSLGSELLGTSTGFPFGNYSYLSGLGYKITGLVPFTIPLSWFYVGFACYLISRVAMDTVQKRSWLRYLGAIGLGAMLFTSWDLVLEPAMSQTAFPFWYWEKPGAFFGTPYQNYAGWFGTSALFMSVATLLWRKTPLKLERSQLSLPLAVYLSNFTFGAVISWASGFVLPVLLGLVVGVIPVLVLWWMAQPAADTVGMDAATQLPVALK